MSQLAHSNADTRPAGLPLETERYTARLAGSSTDLGAAQRLRFEVFNEELGEGLASAWETGRDADQFDAVCDHLLVEERASGRTVGTYRLLPGLRARTTGVGFYSAQEFDFAPFEPQAERLLELGRACVHREHRNQSVLGLLWRGIAVVARAHGSRYLVGCSSLSTQDSAEAAAVYARLAVTHLAPPELRTRPLPAFTLEPVEPAPLDAKIPRLMAAYLAVGARICGEPAIDREFKTVDFLTVLDLDNLPSAVARKYFC
jgi:putative hemolysin